MHLRLASKNSSGLIITCAVCTSLVSGWCILTFKIWENLQPDLCTIEWSGVKLYDAFLCNNLITLLKIKLKGKRDSREGNHKLVEKCNSIIHISVLN